MESTESLRADVIDALKGSEGPLLAREIVSMLAQHQQLHTRSEVNSVLYRGRGIDFQRDSSARWSLLAGAAKEPTGPKRDRRRWSEDETVLAYWALPLLREVSVLTEREFSAVAMKMANLLSVETDSRMGLANASALDRTVVKRYSGDREGLEKRVAQIMSSGELSHNRADEVGRKAVEVLRRTKVPLHYEAVYRLIVAEDPLAAVTTSLVREALSATDNVTEGPEAVFRWAGDPAR